MSKSRTLELIMGQLYIDSNHAVNKLDKILGFGAGNPDIPLELNQELTHLMSMLHKIRTWTREASDLT